MQRLALRVLRGDREAAIVLGDAMMEAGLDRMPTGRVRMAVFESNPSGLPYTEERRRIMTLAEAQVLQAHERVERFQVPAREVLFNVEYFAKHPNEKEWGNIFAMWITPVRVVYQGLIRRGLLPRSIRFRELRVQHANTMYLANGPELAWNISLERIPKRRKRPQRTTLMTVTRLDADRTATRHFENDPPQLSLF